MINPEAMSQAEFWVWFNTAPTQADVDEWVKPGPVDIVTPWRARNREATCSDKVAKALAEIDLAVGVS